MIRLGELELVKCLSGGNIIHRVMRGQTEVWNDRQTMVMVKCKDGSSGRVTFYCETEVSPTYFTSAAYPVAKYRSDNRILFCDNGTYSQVSLLGDGAGADDNANIESIEVVNLSSSIRSFVSAASALPSLTSFTAIGITSGATVFKPVSNCPELKTLLYRDIIMPKCTEVRLAHGCDKLSSVRVENVVMVACTSLEGALSDMPNLRYGGLAKMQCANSVPINCDRLFANCPRITDVYLPDGFLIGSATDMFKGCTSLKFIYTAANSTRIDCDLDMSECPLTASTAGVLVYCGSKSAGKHKLRLSSATYAALQASDQQAIDDAPSMGWTIETV